MGRLVEVADTRLYVEERGEPSWSTSGIDAGVEIADRSVTQAVTCGMHQHAPDQHPQVPHSREVAGVTQHPPCPCPVQHGPLQLADPLPWAE